MESTLLLHVSKVVCCHIMLENRCCDFIKWTNSACVWLIKHDHVTVGQKIEFCDCLRNKWCRTMTFHANHYWSKHLKSPVTRLFVSQLYTQRAKETSTVRINGPSGREPTQKGGVITATSNYHRGVSIECLINSLFQHTTTKHQIPVLLSLCEGGSAGDQWISRTKGQ